MYSYLHLPISGDLESVTSKLERIAAKHGFTLDYIDRDYEVSDILTSYGIKDCENIGLLFVLTGNAEHIAIYGVSGIVPYLDSDLDRLWRI